MPGKKTTEAYFKTLLKEIPIVFRAILNKEYLAHQKGIFYAKSA